MLDIKLSPHRFHSSTPPEFHLLAASSWLAPEHLVSQQSARIIDCCTNPIDWDKFFSLTTRHGVQPLVGTKLGRCACVKLPERIMTKLNAWRRVVTANSLLQSGELLRLVKLFRHRDIDIFPLKGVLLSQQLYDSISMRFSTDLDILVRPDNFDLVCQLLEEEGYICSLHGTQLTPKQKRHILNNLYHLEFCNERKGLTVEVHWKLGSLWLPEHMELVWESIESFKFQGTEVKCLDRIMQLLFLCDHGARHRFCCLKWLSDVARAYSLLESEEWSPLLQRAYRLDLSRTLAHSLLLTNWVFGLPLSPAAAEFANKDNYVQMMSRKVFGLLQMSADMNASHGKRLGGLLCSWQVLRLRSTLPIFRTLKPSLVAAGDFHDYPLPDALFWLYYPLRPISWLKKYYFKS